MKFSALVSMSLSALASAQTPVPVLVWGCESFVTGELWDAFNAEGVKDIMNVTLVPYGNAAIDNATKTVTCQHGESECEGNLWEMCAIDAYPDFEDHFPFYYCLETHGTNMLNFVEQCATSANLSYPALSACFNDEEKAWELEQKYAALTPTYHEYTPWVEVPTGTVLDHQLLFTYTICDQYDGPLPPGCPQASEKAKRSYKNTAMIGGNEMKPMAILD